MLRFEGIGLAAVLAMASASTAAAQLGAAPEGAVRFYNVADADFDPYLTQATAWEKAWMRRRYTRMQTYAPFFDDHLAWYRGAWAYKDLYAIKPEWPVFQDHPEWILRDAAGNLLYIPWACSGGHCPQYAADFGNPAWRAHWIAEARALVDAGYAGLWIDDVNMTWRVGDGAGNHVTPIDPRTGVEMTLGDWRRYIAEFVGEVREALPDAELCHNVVWFAAPTDEPWQRRQIAAADWINLERGVNDDGLKGGGGTWGLETFLAFVDFVHESERPVVLMDHADVVDEREYGLAGWLLVSEGRDLLNNVTLAWTAPDSWWPGYGADLGAALGGRYEWSGLLRRDFVGGAVLLNQPDRPTVTVDLGGPMRTLDGQVVDSVQLAAHRGVVLLELGG